MSGSYHSIVRLISQALSAQKKPGLKTRVIDDCAAPALDLLNDDYQTVRFTGHTKEGSPYQGTPNIKVDANWDRLTKGNSL